MRGLKDKDELFAEIAEDGAVHVEKHFVGRLQGFRFSPDTQAEGIHGKAARNAAAHVLARELGMRARRVAAAKSDAFKLTRRGQILWREEEIARLESSDDPLKPNVVVTADEHLSAPDKDKIQERLVAWITRSSATSEAVGRDCRRAGYLRLGAWDRLSPEREFRRSAARGRRGGDACAGSAGTRPIAQLRRSLRRLQHLLSDPAEAGLRRAALDPVALKNGTSAGLDITAPPEPPRPGLTSLVVDKAVPEAFYRVAGFHVCGPRAVRIDMLERLADLIRPLVAWRADPANPSAAPPKGATGDGGFRATPEMMSILGCSAGELGNVLQTLGFRLDRVRLEPVPAKSAEAQANGAAPVEGHADQVQEAAPPEAQTTPIAVAPPDAAIVAEAPADANTAQDRLHRPINPHRRPSPKSNGMKSGVLGAKAATRRGPTATSLPAAGTSPGRPKIADSQPTPLPDGGWRRRPPDRRERRRDGPPQRRDDRPRTNMQSASPPSKGSIDPDSPFAALHSLKLALEKPRQD